ncbi:MAG: fibronectin type III domain-containing protein [Treponema sp.]|jgi:hypothetical protein|nr:fibronectin type III domain-containing protein [Treponema sp.]
MKNHTFLIGLVVIVCAALLGCDMPVLNNNLREPFITITGIPGEVTYLNAAVQANRIRLSWINPTNEDFDHTEISYSAGNGPIQVLPPVAKTLQLKTIESLIYGSTYVFTVKAVDSGGNKSLGTVTIATLDKVIDDLDLDRYVTAPMAGAPPSTQAISAVQYNGVISWRNYMNNPFTGSVFVADTEYRAVVTLTANPGYTFQGVGMNRFTHTGTTSITNPQNSGTVAIVFQKAVQGWYVSNVSGNDNNGGATLGDSLKTVGAAVEKIRTAYCKIRRI